jgi:hypothetical protein
MKANTINIVGRAAQDAFVSDKAEFASVNVEIPGPDGRGRAWMDCVGFKDVSKSLAALKAGDVVNLIAAPDSRKTEKNGWRMRFVVEALNETPTQLPLDAKETS